MINDPHWPHMNCVTNVERHFPRHQCAPDSRPVLAVSRRDPLSALPRLLPRSDAAQMWSLGRRVLKSMRAPTERCSRRSGSGLS